MNRYVKAAMLLAVLGFAVWNAVGGRWVWAAVDVVAFLLGIYGLRVLEETARREPVKVATDLAEPPVTPPAALLRDESWNEHIANCAPCRDFWKNDGL